MNDIPHDKLALSVREAAELLGISTPMMYQLTRAEGFPAFHIGTRTVISRARLTDWVDAQAMKS